MWSLCSRLNTYHTYSRFSERLESVSAPGMEQHCFQSRPKVDWIAETRLAGVMAAPAFPARAFCDISSPDGTRITFASSLLLPSSPFYSSPSREGEGCKAKRIQKRSISVGGAFEFSSLRSKLSLGCCQRFFCHRVWRVCNDALIFLLKFPNEIFSSLEIKILTVSYLVFYNRSYCMSQAF